MLVPLLAAAAFSLGGGAPAPLPLDQAVGQRVIASLPGTTLPDALAADIRAGHVAGVILFSRNIASRAQLRALTARMQAERRHGPRALRDLPLLVMIDQEGGLVKRLPGAPDHSPAELGRIGSAALARSDGAAAGRNLRGVGVNVDLAPVLDVGMPGSSVRALGRTYGATPRMVIRLGLGFADGLAAAGVLACVKHFPGLGRGVAIEDDVLNRIDAPLDALRRVDEAPFRAAARHGVPLAMVSTGVYPALSGRPAMFAPTIATGELRERVGFGGVAITDDLEVAALARLSPARKALAAVRAGDDLLLFAQTAAAADAGRAALVRAVRAGTLPRATIDAGAARVLALRERLR
ncbi:MAG TPA: glycoside hydrolase family 3 N-terminal domain-containing protein [Conexibacter sp.]|nr:glycoside hydrolase family 3 N-terminal domain-containing protein [Conexibacter sp.]